MINWIRQQFCKHEIQIVEDYEFVNIKRAMSTVQVLRRYLVCTECGYRKKISGR